MRFGNVLQPPGRLRAELPLDMLTCNAAAKAFSQASAWLQAATVLQVLEAWEGRGSRECR